MKTKDGFIQGYGNAQAAVDATAQVIVVPTASTRSRAININWAADGRRHRSQSEVQEADATVGGRGLLLRRQPYGDGGTREIDAYIAPGRAKHAGEGEGGGARVAAMRAKESRRSAGTPAPTA